MYLVDLDTSLRNLQCVIRASGVSAGCQVVVKRGQAVIHDAVAATVEDALRQAAQTCMRLAPPGGWPAYIKGSRNEVYLNPQANRWLRHGNELEWRQEPDDSISCTLINAHGSTVHVEWAGTILSSCDLATDYIWYSDIGRARSSPARRR